MMHNNFTKHSEKLKIKSSKHKFALLWIFSLSCLFIGAKFQTITPDSLVIMEDESWKNTFDESGKCIGNTDKRSQAIYIKDPAVVNSIFQSLFVKEQKEKDIAKYPGCSKHWKINYLKNNRIIAENYVDTFCRNYIPNYVLENKKYFTQAPNSYVYSVQVSSSISINELQEQIGNKYILLHTFDKKNGYTGLNFAKVIFKTNLIQNREKPLSYNQREINDSVLTNRNNMKANQMIDILKKKYSILFFEGDGSSSSNDFTSNSYKIYFKNGTRLDGLEKEILQFGGKVIEINNASSYRVLIISSEPSLEIISRNIKQKSSSVISILNY